ncbi:MAG: hypothetical protein J5641_02945, partial [Bacteroidales bacterium]|nr:hypothetical protein [Bacteroidales bacterium]
TKLKKYQSPTVKVVAFKVENAFGSMMQNGETTDNVINFGGSEETGLMSHDSYDHSGLGQYGYNSDLFGSN